MRDRQRAVEVLPKLFTGVGKGRLFGFAEQDHLGPGDREALWGSELDQRVLEGVEFTVELCTDGKLGAFLDPCPGKEGAPGGVRPGRQVYPS